jgi:alpha-glucosidase (family GH31 glycosyl hydrolase)
VLFSRAGYTGAQSASSHWAGDEASNWEAFRSSIRAMLNAGLCGFSFMGWDIAGFAGPLPDADLYLRASAFSAFCPIMQYHSDGNGRQIPSRDRTPWNLQEQSGDTRVIPLFRKFANLRVNLAPYILAQARLSHQSGLPLMRGLPLEFPGDEGIRATPYEYLFGEHLLVAPVVANGIRQWPVYLPKGAWRELWSGAALQGGQSLNVDVDHSSIPVYIRQGGIIPLNLGDDLALGEPASGSPESVKNLTALVFPGEESSAELFQGKGREYGQITVKRDPGDGSVQIKLAGLEVAIELLVLGEQPRQVSLDGSPIAQESGQVSSGQAFWQWLPERQAAQIHLPPARPR